jgi:hypothetical protein
MNVKVSWVYFAAGRAQLIPICDSWATGEDMNREQYLFKDTVFRKIQFFSFRVTGVEMNRKQYIFKHTVFRKIQFFSFRVTGAEMNRKQYIFKNIVFRLV